MTSTTPTPAGPCDETIAPNGWTWGVLRGFRNGDRGALREVYTQHVDDVGRQLRHGFSFESRGRAHRFVGYASGFDFHDALHETFRRAFEPRARERYDGMRPYGAYLRAIARNIVLRSFRAREVLFPSIDDERADGATAVDPGRQAMPSPEQSVAQAQVQELVQNFLGELAPHDRELVQLRFVEGLSQRDVAERLDMGRQQVRGRENKLRRQLLSFLRERGESSLVPGGAAMVLVAVANLLGASAMGLPR